MSEQGSMPIHVNSLVKFNQEFNQYFKVSPADIMKEIQLYYNHDFSNENYVYMTTDIPVPELRGNIPKFETSNLTRVKFIDEVLGAEKVRLYVDAKTTLPTFRAEHLMISDDIHGNVPLSRLVHHIKLEREWNSKFNAYCIENVILP